VGDAVSQIVDLDEDHVYRVDGDITPGVSEILKAGGYGNPAETESGYIISDEVIENSRDRGIIIHDAAKLLIFNDLDWDSVDDECLPYLVGLANWQAETGFYPVEAEKLFYEPEYQYCGTRDLVGYIGEDLVIPDIKSGSAGLKPWHKYQLAAYAYPMSERGTKWPRRIMLHLKKDGKCKPHEFPRAKAQWDMEVFLACRTLWLARELEARSTRSYGKS
jgi:hypothetical protein